MHLSRWMYGLFVGTCQRTSRCHKHMAGTQITKPFFFLEFRKWKLQKICRVRKVFQHKDFMKPFQKLWAPFFFANLQVWWCWVICTSTQLKQLRDLWFDDLMIRLCTFFQMCWWIEIFRSFTDEAKATSFLSEGSGLSCRKEGLGLWSWT